MSASGSRNTNDRQEFFNKANGRMQRVMDSQTNFAMIDSGRPAAVVVAHFASHGLVLPPSDPALRKIRSRISGDARADGRILASLGPDAGDPLALMSFVRGPVPR